jgi:hypothetical protein
MPGGDQGVGVRHRQPEFQARGDRAVRRAALGQRPGDPRGEQRGGRAEPGRRRHARQRRDGQARRAHGGEGRRAQHRGTGPVRRGVLARGDARDPHRGGGGGEQTADLQRQAGAHRVPQRVRPRLGHGAGLHGRTDDGPADEVHTQEHPRRARLAANETHGAVQRAEQRGLSAERRAGPTRGVVIGGAGARVRVQSQLPAGEGIERESGGDLGRALGAAGDHLALHGREGAEQQEARHRRLAGQGGAQGVDDAAGLAIRQQRAGDGHAEAQAEQRERQQRARQAGQRGGARGVPNESEQQRCGRQRRGEREIQHETGQGHHEEHRERRDEEAARSVLPRQTRLARSRSETPHGPIE